MVVNYDFDVHKDIRSHIGGMIPHGGGAVYTGSTWQGINAKNSIESQLVGANDFIHQVIVTQYFIEAQRYDAKENIKYQDNQSSILLGNNGKGYISKRTRHIKTLYFFIADRIVLEDLDVEYCPTWDMLADFFNKPLQDSLFRKFFSAILNVKY